MTSAKLSTLSLWLGVLGIAAHFSGAFNTLTVASGAVQNARPAQGAAASGAGGLTPAWSLDGAWTGVVGDESSPTFYALGRGGKCVEIDAAGKVVRDIALSHEDGSLLRLAHFAGPARLALLAFRVWGNELHAYGVDGTRLWTYPVAGVNDVWAADVSGERSDEVIVGYNGATGLHVLDDQGRLLWKTTEIGNVWHVSAGDLWGLGGRQVVATSASGLVHVFRNGQSPSIRLPVLRVPPAPIVPATYATMVRVGKATKTDKSATMFVVGERPMNGPGPVTEHVVALSLARGKEWTLELPVKAGRPHVDSASLASGQPWLAVGLRGGQVYVVDVAEGRIIRAVDGQGMEPEVSWARGGTDAPLLLVATGTKINSFKVR